MGIDNIDALKPNGGKEIEVNILPPTNPDMDPKGGLLTFFWPYEENAIMTDEAVYKLIDQKTTFILGDKRVKARIYNAVNQPENGGVMLSIEW